MSRSTASWTISELSVLVLSSDVSPPTAEYGLSVAVTGLSTADRGLSAAVTGRPLTEPPAAPVPVALDAMGLAVAGGVTPNPTLGTATDVLGFVAESGRIIGAFSELSAPLKYISVWLAAQKKK